MFKDLLQTIQQGKYTGHVEKRYVQPGTQYRTPKNIGSGPHGQVRYGHNVEKRYVQPAPVRPHMKALAQHVASNALSPNIPGTNNYGTELTALFNSIKDQESNNNYSAVGIPTHGGRAMGAYQIMSGNIEGPGGWDKEILGRNISVQDFMNNPQLQDQIAQAKLSQYYKDYGAVGASKAWYGGPGAVSRNGNGSEYGGPSINGYAASVRRRMRGY